MAAFDRWRRGRTPLPSPNGITLEGTLAFLTAYGRSEVRSGKAISAANREKIQAAIDVLKRLLADAERSRWS